MKLIFGLQLDGVVFPKPQTEAGALYAGPLALLKFLEARLGLEGPQEKNEHIRIELYRQAAAGLLEIQSGVFFKQSFEADPIGCAAYLLALRDELMGAGLKWAYVTADSPERIQHLAGIEKFYDDREKGLAERLVTATEGLIHKKTPMESIQIIEPFDLLPAVFKNILNRLSQSSGRPVEAFKFSGAAEGESDLSLFKNFLLSPPTQKTAPFAPKGDGSLLILKAKRETDAAIWIAQFLQKNRHCRPAFFLADNTLVVEDAMSQEGLPCFGVGSSSLSRPALQILKLATAFLWSPLDPFKILQFTALAFKPLSDELAAEIGRVMSQKPGIDGDHWRESIESFFVKLKERAAVDQKIDYRMIRSQYEFWFERSHYLTEAPKSEVIQLFEYLSGWAVGEYRRRKGKYPSLLTLSEQAGKIKEYFETVALERDAITPLELKSVIDSIIEPSPVQTNPEELNRYHYFRNESCLLQPAEELIWWNFIDVAPAHYFSKWYGDELLWLEQNGIFPLLPKHENALKVWYRNKPALQTSRRLILVLPEKVNGKPVIEHPLYCHLKACFKDLDLLSMGIPSVGEDNRLFASSLYRLPETEDIKTEIFAESSPFLHLQNRNFDLATEYETPTGLESLFYYPHQWVFKKMAKLGGSQILNVVSDHALAGNLAHRLFELALKENFYSWSQDATSAWLEKNCLSLVVQEGAPLMMYGKEPERLQFIQTLKSSLWRLILFIKENGWTVKATEMDLTGTFADVPLKGKADVVLERQNELCIVDLKWAGRSARQNMIKNQEDIQLQLYGSMLLHNGNVPHSAYFIISEGIMLARNSSAFKEVRSIVPGSDHADAHKDVYLKMINTYQWRKDQLKQGKIEIRTEQTAKELEAEYGAELMDVLEMKKENARFDDYTALLGH